jgi:hypothetical protein
LAEALGEKIWSRLSKHAQIPRLQHRAAKPRLIRFIAMPVRNPAIAQAYATGCYSLQDIAQAFDLRSATVTSIVKTAEKV